MSGLQFVSSGASGSAGSSGLTPTPVKTANYTAVAGDLVRVDTTSGPVTVTLPAATVGAAPVGVKLVTLGGSNAVTITAAGSDVFNKAGGATTLTLSLLNQSVVLAPIAGVWVAQSDDLPLSQLDSRFRPVVLPWVTGTAYAAGQPVTNGGATYTANDAHTAGATFAGDRVAHWTRLPAARSGLVIPKLTVYGDSLGLGYLVGVTNRKSSKLARLLGATEANGAVTGSTMLQDNLSPNPSGGVSTGGWVTLMQGVAPVSGPAYPLSALYSAMTTWGINDLAAWGPANATYLGIWKNVLRAVINRLRAGQVYDYNDATITFGNGSWLNNARTDVCSGAGTKIVNTNGATFDIAVPSTYKGQPIAVQFTAGGTTPKSATVTWTVDGAAAGSDSTLGHVVGVEYLPFVHRFTGLSAGAHTIRGTISNHVDYFEFDCWSIEANPAPYVLVSDILRCTAAGYALFNPGAFGWSRAPTDADVNAVNAAMDTVAAEFDSHVIRDGADAIINANPDYFIDGVHLNAYGTSLVAAEIQRRLEAVVNPADLAYLGTA